VSVCGLNKAARFTHGEGPRVFALLRTTVLHWVNFLSLCSYKDDDNENKPTLPF